MLSGTTVVLNSWALEGFSWRFRPSVCLPLQGLQETIPRKPSRLTSFMGRLVLDQAVSRRPRPQHSSLVTSLISTMSHLCSGPCCSQHIPAGGRQHSRTQLSTARSKYFISLSGGVDCMRSQCLDGKKAARLNLRSLSK